ncbi:MAG: hypothetical protein KDA65_00460 [Planctomycetaceae bacterium]|nr:hypothetical protein [Planctomycetaceae bacterium]
MARKKKKSSSSKPKATAKSRPERKSIPKKKRHESDQTWGDWLAKSLSPLLIMLMVGCLLYFFVNTFYQGYYAKRLYYIMGFFTFAAVFISRISINTGRIRAGVYGVALAIVTGLSIISYIEKPIPAMILAALIWWCAKKMTWDCTLINDEEDASGEGLLQHTGFEKRLEPVEHRVPFWKRLFRKKSDEEHRPHAPGVWILYFSFAAIPVFGFGQFLIEVDGPDGVGAEKRLLSFNLLLIYMAGALGLLLLTSLLGLRRYLKQRGLQIPMRIVTTWIGTGTVLILLLLLGSYFLPRPSLLADFGPMAGLSDVKFGTDYYDHEESQFKLGYGVDRDDPDVDPMMLLDVDLKEEEKEDKKPEAIVTRKKPEEKKERNDEPESETPPNQQEPETDPTPDQKKPPEEETLLAEATPNPEKDPVPPQSPSEPPPEEKKPTLTPTKDPESKTGKIPDPEGTPEPKAEPEPTPQAKPEVKPEPPPEEQKPPEKKEELKPEPPPEEPEVQTAEFNWFLLGMSLLSLLILLVIGYLLYRYRAVWLRWWYLLFGKKKTEEEEIGEESESREQILMLAPQEKPQPFRKYRNPFEDGTAENRTNAEIVCYTFSALESWAYEQNQERAPEKTPMEFCYDLERHHDRFENSAKQLSRWYTSYAYAEREPDDSCRPELKQVWQVMLHEEAEPEPEFAEEDDLDTTEFPVSKM